MENPGLQVHAENSDLGRTFEERGVVDLYDVSDDWLPIRDDRIRDITWPSVPTEISLNAPIAGHCMAELIKACEKGRP